MQVRKLCKHEKGNKDTLKVFKYLVNLNPKRYSLESSLSYRGRSRFLIFILRCKGRVAGSVAIDLEFDKYITWEK